MLSAAPNADASELAMSARAGPDSYELAPVGDSLATYNHSSSADGDAAAAERQTAGASAEFSEQTAVLTLGQPDSDEEDEEKGPQASDDAGPEDPAGSPAAPAATRHADSDSRREEAAGLLFHELSYEVAQRKYCRKLPNKTILHSVSGLLIPGLNAIMGPTGSGKTTLLDLLADRRDKAGKTGRILLNGKRRPSNYKRAVGYVVQDDIVLGTLSVRENLQFSANLRLPAHLTRQQRRERVDRVIEELGLQACANTKVGTEFLRGVSGGERKRTNIGMELIIQPQVLFLDEPTTGLDAHTAVSVVQLLKDLCSGNARVMAMVIHQPRYSIFKLFDSLTILCRGHIIYQGNPHASIQYFADRGYECEEHENPADFLLDAINHCEREVLTMVHVNPQAEVNMGVAKGQKKGAARGKEMGVVREQEMDLIGSYQRSEQYSSLCRQLDPILQRARGEDKERGMAGKVGRRLGKSHLYVTSFPWQFLILCYRSILNIVRSPITSILQVLTVTFFALVIGAVFWQLETDPNGFTDRVGLFFFVGAQMAFGSLAAIELFVAQKSIFFHENTSGYYRVSAFFLSKTLVDIIALRILPNTIFVTITFFMIGMQVSAGQFFTYWLLVMLVNLCALSLAFMVGAAVTTAGLANLLIIIPFIVSLIFGGLLISLDSLPAWVSWIGYLSFMRYAIEGMCINEMTGLTFEGECLGEMMDSSCGRDAFNITSQGSGVGSGLYISGVYLSGDMMVNASEEECSNICSFDGLDQLGVLGYETDWLWYDVLALCALILIFQTLAYVFLRLVKKQT